MEAHVFRQLKDSVNLLVCQPRPNFDRILSTTAVELLYRRGQSGSFIAGYLGTCSFLKLPLNFSYNVLPVRKKPVQPQKDPADRFLVPAWHVVFFVFVEVREEEVMHHVLCNKLGLCEDKSDRDISVEATGTTSAAPGSNTEAVIVDCARRTRLYQYHIDGSFRERLLTVISALWSPSWTFLAEGPPVYIRHVHLIYEEGPWYLGGPLVASLWELDSIVKLQRSVEVGEFIVAIINAGRNNLLQPAGPS